MDLKEKAMEAARDMRGIFCPHDRVSHDCLECIAAAMLDFAADCVDLSLISEDTGHGRLVIGANMRQAAAALRKR